MLRRAQPLTRRLIHQESLLLKSSTVKSATTALLQSKPTRSSIISKPVPCFIQQKRTMASGPNFRMNMNQNQQPEQEQSPLEQFGTNLTELAKQGKLDPVIGRDQEIQRAIQILSRRTKNNPVLIGRAGVGKTSLIDGLAQRIVRGEVPESLKNKELYTLDLGALIAGAKFRGEFEERLKGVLEQIDKANGEIIVFIDEVHMLLGLGKTDGSMDASNILKPKLARGLRCISATTLDEFKIIEKDPALSRRFQPILLNEPSVADTISILRGLKERYEVHHGVRITDTALVSAATLSNRYITDRFLPDKAIDLIDEACAVLRLQHESKPDSIQILDRSIMTIQIELESLKKETDPVSKSRREDLEKELKLKSEELSRLTEVWEAEKKEIESIKNAKKDLEEARVELEIAQREGNFGKASELRYSKIPELEQKVALSEQEEQKENSLLHESVSADDISKVVSKMTGIPIDTVLKGDKDRLLYMENSLKERVVGQDEAIHAIADAVRLQRAGLTSDKRPIASFMFLGPTGTGKTELTKALAEFLFDDANNVIRFDMSEFQEKHTVSRLVGSPPGYIGHEEGGQLTEAVRRKPYSVVLFDEFEKAHVDVSKVLLQVLDEGKLTDAKGTVVDFKNTLIVMTSNIGQDILLNDSEAAESSTVSPQTKRKVIDAMKRQYPPEFINRIDELLIFNRLSKDVFGSILDIRLKEVQERIIDKRIALNLNEEAREWLINHGYDPLYGARPLNRVIQKKLLNPMATLLLKGQIQNDETVNVTVKDGELNIQANHDPENHTPKKNMGTDKNNDEKPGSVKAELVD